MSNLYDGKYGAKTKEFEKDGKLYEVFHDTDKGTTTFVINHGEKIVGPLSALQLMALISQGIASTP